jgi:hypothetical protein
MNQSKETCHFPLGAFSQIEQILNQNGYGTQVGPLEKL